MMKARKTAEKLGISTHDFKASWGWFRNFRIRKGIKSALLYGEEGEVDKSDPVLLEKLRKLSDKIREFDAENVYNMDETALFYRLLPRYSVLLPDEDISSLRGKKKSKERVTLAVCSNATGSHKLPLTMLAKPKNPACLRNSQWPLVYYNQKRGWMDAKTYKRWFEEVFYPEVRKKTHKPVLLLLDNAPAHCDGLSKDDVTVTFFPPGCTSWKQPCDLGIIAAIKRRYKYLYLNEVLNFYNLDQSLRLDIKQQAAKKRRGSVGVLDGSPANLLDAARIATVAWEAVSSSTIRNCFRKAELGMELHPGCMRQLNFGELANQLTTSGIPVTTEELDDFSVLDCENSIVLNETILEDLDDVFENPDTENSSSSISPPNSPEQVNFDGYDVLYRKTFLFSEQLRTPQAEAIASTAYSELKDSFENFQRNLQKMIGQSTSMDSV